MNTELIEVLIGVVLAFALVSLMATTLQELWNTGTKMRGKVLLQSISSMLGDDTQFAQAILDHPLLVSMTPQTQGERSARKPSYVKADVLVSALLGHLVDTYAAGQRPETPAQLLDAIKNGGSAQPSAAMAGAASTGPNPMLIRGLSAVVQGSERDWPAFESRLMAWYEAVGERATGWFKRKTQVGVFLIGTGLAFAMNINPFVIAVKLWTDAPLRARVMAMAESISADHEAKASGKAPAGTAQAASANAAGQPEPTSPARTIQQARSLMEEMWTAQDALKGIADEKAFGLVGGQTLRISDLVERWESSTSAESTTIQAALASELKTLADLTPVSQAFEGVRRTTAALQGIVGSHNKAAAQAAPKNPRPNTSDPSTADVHDKALQTRCQQTEGDEAAPTDGTSSEFARQLCAMQALQAQGFPIGWSKSNQLYAVRSLCGRSDAACWNGWHGWVDWLLMFVGWAFMGVASTFGAPFWFDALSRLVRLRAAGRQQADKADAADGKGGTDKGVMTPPSPQPQDPSGGNGAYEPMSDALNDDEKALTSLQVQRVQRGLDMDELDITGVFDGKTRDAIKAWQARHDGEGTGILSRAEIAELLKMPLARQGSAAPSANTGMGTGTDTAAGAPTPDADDSAACCDHGITDADATPDHDLPATSGGVADPD